MIAKPVIVLPYDARWAQDFLLIRDEIQSVLGGLAQRIEHVGSTSVRGLSAKPIIDIDVVIKDYTLFDDVVSSLDRIGYTHQGNLGIAGREAFKYDGKVHLQSHHLSVCPLDSDELKRHIAFRNYLRSHPEAVREYSQIKEEGAALYPFDIDKYMAYKSPFIEKVYREIGIYTILSLKCYQARRWFFVDARMGNAGLLEASQVFQTQQLRKSSP